MLKQILAIDTATEACSVALWRDGYIFTQYAISPKKHIKKILPMIEQCLINAKLNLRGINLLAFGRGPGSFTSVRIGVGIAQGLAFGANLPMIGISSLLTIAQGVYRQLGKKKVLVTIDAKMGGIYAACYEFKANGSWQGEETERLVKPKEFLEIINKLTGEWAIAGTGWSTYPILRMTNLNLLETGIFLPNAEDMLFLSLQEHQKGKILHAEEAHPTYLYNELKWKKLPGR